jgi:hypothetical protein
MEQKQAEKLIADLIGNKITRRQFETLLIAVECPKMAFLLEKSLMDYFSVCLKESAKPRNN